MKKIILSFLIFCGLLFSATPIFADSISEGYKSVKYCIQFTNMADFSDYSLFKVCDTTMPSVAEMTDPNGCYGMYKFCNFKVCAIKKEKMFEELRAEINDYDREDITTKIVNNPDFVCKDLNYRPVSQVRDSDPTTSITDVYSLPDFSISDSQVIKEKVVYNQENSKVAEEIPYTSDTRPISKYSQNTPLTVYVLVGGIILLIILLSIIQIKKLKRKSI